MKTALILVSALSIGCASAPSASRVGPAMGTTMIFGDSIAYQLAQSVEGVVNSGKPSERLSTALKADTDTAGEERIVREVGNVRPHTVLIIQGTNDVLEGVYMGGEAWLDQAEGALRRVVQACKSAGVRRVVVATVPPQRAGGQRKRDPYVAHIPRLNERVRKVVAEEGVELVDVFAIVSGNLSGYLSADDVHLTAEGNKAVWRAFATSVR